MARIPERTQHEFWIYMKLGSIGTFEVSILNASRKWKWNIYCSVEFLCKIIENTVTNFVSLYMIVYRNFLCFNASDIRASHLPNWLTPQNKKLW